MTVSPVDKRSGVSCLRPYSQAQRPPLSARRRPGTARAATSARRLWTCRFAWTTPARCPHAHSRNSSNRQQSRTDLQVTNGRPLDLTLMTA